MQSVFLLAAAAVFLASLPSSAYPAVVGPDEACRWLAAKQLEESGWLCCTNRTLTVQDGRIVGRRRGLTGFCADLLEEESTLEPLPAVQVGGTGWLNLYETIFLVLALFLLSFVTTVLPVYGVYLCWLGRAVVPVALPVSDMSETASQFEYIDPAAYKTLEL